MFTPWQDAPREWIFRRGLVLVLNFQKLFRKCLDFHQRNKRCELSVWMSLCPFLHLCSVFGRRIQKQNASHFFSLQCTIAIFPCLYGLRLGALTNMLVPTLVNVLAFCTLLYIPNDTTIRFALANEQTQRK